MDFNLTDDQRLLGETLERFLADNYSIERRHENAKCEEGYSADTWAQMAELGLIGALFPEEVGGFGGTGTDLTVIFENLGKSLVVEPFLPTLLAGRVLLEAGNEVQKEILSNAISGESRIAFAHSEPNSHYDLDHVECSASKTDNGFQLTGNKSVVLGGANADHLIVSARTSGKPANDVGISLFMVDPKSSGVRLRSFGTVDGYGGAEFSFESVDAELIGEIEKALPVIESAHAYAITALCAETLGAMEIAKDLTVEYMHTRNQFGVPIGKFQALQHRMADVLIEIEQMRSSLINAAGNLNSDRKTRERSVSAAKHLAGTIGRLVGEEAIQIHGGNGMTWEYAVSHYAKRLIMIDHIFGDTDHHLERYISLN